jgi:hypothetical protein
VPDVLPLLRAIYDRSSVGCCLHVLADDGNYDSAEFCADVARERGHEDCLRLALMLARMSRTQVVKACRTWSDA